MAALDPLGQASLRLAKADPLAWNDFKKAFADGMQQTLMTLASAPADKILTAQGYAQAWVSMLRTFNECTQERPQKPAPVA